MAMEIEDFPIKNGESFHSKLLIYPSFMWEIPQHMAYCNYLRKGWKKCQFQMGLNNFGIMWVKQ